MKINNINYIVPNKENPVGKISLDIEDFILYNENQKSIAEKNNEEITMSVKTLDLFKQAVDALIEDLSK
jgi:ribonucleotide reductase alpha subunit